MRIKFVKYLGIGHILNFTMKIYFDDNTEYKEEYGDICAHIYEFRFINGKRYIYKTLCKKDFDIKETREELMEMIESVKNFLDVVIVSIEMK